MQPIFFFLSRGECRFAKEEEKKKKKKVLEGLSKNWGKAAPTKQKHEREEIVTTKKNNAEEVWFLSHDERSHRAVLNIKTSLIILYLYKVNVA